MHDVLARRLQRLPEETVSTLRWAALVGRQFDLATLAAVSRLDEDDLLDHLDPALEAGLVREDGIDRFLFGHALVRDTIYAAIPTTRRARAHARVAEALSGIAGRETRGGAALARRRSGARRRGPGWPACGPAAVARRLHAYEESADLLRSALDALPGDPDATLGERYDVLMDLADAQRWSGDWEGLVGTAEQAIAVADEIGDVVLLGRAATATSVGALWQSGPHGSVNEVVVGALRRVLAGAADRRRRAAVPGDARAWRSRSTTAPPSRSAARWSRRASRWPGGSATTRCCSTPASSPTSPCGARRPPSCARDLVTEGMELAHRLGDERAYVVTTTLRAVVAGELGLVEEMWEHAVVARDWAERLRLPYGLIVLDSLELPWLAMAGRFDECERADGRHRAARPGDDAGPDRGRDGRGADVAAAVAGSLGGGGPDPRAVRRSTACCP